MDFGLAKRESGEITMTVEGHVLGTPAYMSPEQARGEGHTADRRADVYSLGVILFELLTGERPFRGEKRMLIVQILNEEPPRPRKLDSRIPRDLETICLKCLEKQTQRRYATAAELAADLNRFLAGEPTHARPVSRPERLWRWSRRNPLVAALSSATVLLLIAVAVLGTVACMLTSRALAGETEQRELAEENFQKARQVVDEFFTDVSESRELLRGTPGTQQLRKRLLERAQKYYEDFTRRRAGDEKLQAELALAHFRLARIAAETGEKPKALAAYRKALEMLERLARQNPAVPKYQRDLAASYNNIGNLHNLTGKRAEALAAYQKALEIQERLVRENPAVPEYKSNLAGSHNNIGAFHKQTGKRAEALAAYRKALKIRERLVRENPIVPEYQNNLAASYNNIGNSLKQTGKPADALAAYQEAIEIRERLVRENPNVIAYKKDLAGSYNNIAVLYSVIGKPAEALVAFQKALEIQQRLARKNANVTEYRSDLAASYNNIGVLHKNIRKRAEALAAQQTALGIRERLVRENPNVPEFRNDLAASLNNIGILHKETGERDKAVAAYRKALKIRERLARDYPTVVDYAVRLGESYLNLGKLVSETDEPEPALDWCRRAIETLEGVLKRVPRHLTARIRLRNAHWGRAEVLEKLKQPAQAVADWERAIELDTGQRRQSYRIRLGSSVARAGDHVRAAREAKALAEAAKENASVLYNVACIYSLSAAAAAKDKSLEQTKRSKLADEYALRAIDLLKRSQAAGFFKTAANVEHMKKDADLDSLRMLADFKKLLSEIEAKKM